MQQRPYHGDSTASRLLSEVNHHRVRLVLRCGTTLDSRLLFFLPFLFATTIAFCLTILLCDPPTAIEPILLTTHYSLGGLTWRWSLLAHYMYCKHFVWKGSEGSVELFLPALNNKFLLLLFRSFNKSNSSASKIHCLLLPSFSHLLI